MKTRIFILALIVATLVVARSVFSQSLVISGGSRSFIVSGHKPAAVPEIVVEPVVPTLPVEAPSQPKQIEQPNGSAWPGFGDAGVLPTPAPPNRYIQWPGWGVIDLETYNRNCNCGMCQSIRGKQQAYRSQLAAWKAATVKPKYTQEAVTASQQATPAAVVDQAVAELKLQPTDVVADLGCGDGRILIAAVRKYRCRGIGVEIDDAVAQSARRLVAAAGLSNSIRIITGDAVEFDPDKHGVTAITAYLYPGLLKQLLPVFRNKRVRVVASPYHEIPGLAMVKSGDVFVYRRPLEAMVAKSSDQYNVEGVCRLSSGGAYWSGVVIGPGRILTVGHHQKKGPFKAEFRRGVGFEFASVTCELLKSDEALDLSLLKFEVTEQVRPRVYKLRKGVPNRIWGFFHGKTAKTFRVIPQGKTIKMPNGRQTTMMKAEGVTSPQHGMSGSPVFTDYDVTGIKWGGDGSDVYAVDYETIQEFLNDPPKESPAMSELPAGIDPDFFLVMFTAPWCGACQAEKNTDRFGKLKEKFRVTEVDVDQQPIWTTAHGSLPAVERLPTFWMVRRNNPEMLRSWSGGLDVDSALLAANSIRSQISK